mmetsp:Transcript_50070/g.98936  ORF Transcript_50070/g.98936 Transcript_50070/m.98936 type:complete len:320 (+) Transcript_50070:19-978(+)
MSKEVDLDAAADFIVVPKLLSHKEVLSFEKFCEERVTLMPAEHFSKDGDKNEPRNSAIAWLANKSQKAATSSSDETSCPEWLHDRLVSAVQSGAETWPTVLPEALKRRRGRVSYEDVQYATYKEGGHYKQWHLDGKPDSMRDGDNEDTRALSVVVLLEAASQGGEFQTYAGSGFEALEKRTVVPVELQSGDAIVFPAQRLWHRVDAVTKGRRSSLVFWASPKDMTTAPSSSAATSSVADITSMQETKKGTKRGRGRLTIDKEQGAEKAKVKDPSGVGAEDGDDAGDDEDAEWLEIERKFGTGELSNMRDDYDECTGEDE